MMNYLEEFSRQVRDTPESKAERIEQQLSKITNCEHENTDIRYRLCSNGSKMYSKQCLKCGQQVGGWINKRDIPNINSIKPIDDELKQTISTLRYELHQRLWGVKKEEERERFFTDYDEYLKTDEWAHKRRAVLNRCNHICEGCGSATATQVHHLTYKHYRREFLFELVGICPTCHNAIHAQEDQNAANDA